MLSISQPMKGAGKGNYYLRLAQEDYYIGRQEEPGRWFGEAAQRFGLTGTVERRSFLNLLRGCSPDGKTDLVQNARSDQRQSGWDLTFSAPKSVSVLWVVAPPEIRAQVQETHHHAVLTALTHLEKTAGVTRRGKGGAIKEQARLFFATFQHGSSRASDPQLHTHVILHNLALRQDGTTGSIETLKIFRAKMATGALYQETLATQLRERLGLVIEKERVGFHIVGVPKELCEQFSKRRKVIRRALEKHGQNNAVAAKVATLDTRPRKERISREELFARWQQTGVAHGFGAPEADALVRRRDMRTRSQAQQQETADRHRPSSGDRREQRPTEPQPPNQDSNTCHDPPCERQPRVRTVKGTRLGWDEVQKALGHAQSWIRNQKAKAIASELVRQNSKWSEIHASLDLWVGQLRIQNRRLFPRAPRWSPVRRLALPAIRFVPHSDNARWWKVRARLDLLMGELRIQDRRLFPHAPHWSPLHRLALPAIRFVSYNDSLGYKPGLGKWGDTLWKRDFLWWELRLQKRRLFRFAPVGARTRWAQLPAFHLVRREPELKHAKQLPPARIRMSR